MAGAVTTAVWAGEAAAKVVLRANSQWAETNTNSQTDKWWAEEIAKRTNGEVEVKLYFGGALGKAQENLDLLQQGAVDFAMMSPGYFPAQLPFEAAPNSIPMALSNVEQASKLVMRLMNEVPEFTGEAERLGLKPLLFHHLNPYLLVCRDEVRGIDDMKGKKMRTWGEALPRAVEAVGATPVTLFLPELYEGLAHGTVDCIPFSVDLMVDYKIYEVAKHVMDITIWEGPTAGTYMAISAWNRLTPEQQQIVLEVSHEAMLRDRDAVIAAGERAADELRAKGVQFHAFPKEEAAAWRALNPDFFADFVAAQAERGHREDAEKMIAIWKEVQAE
ncbi:MAG: hypothetical protein Kow0058_12500 [Roseovarius sp.]